MTPEEIRRQALDHMAKNQQWNRGDEAGLNELSGVDVLREPKERAMEIAGPGAVQQLIDLLVPTEVGLNQLGQAKKGAGLAAGVMGLTKPKTAMDKLETVGTQIWDKADISKKIGDKLNEIPVWKRKLGK